MSLFNPALSSYTSGAMYHAVPHCDGLLEQECSNCTANPKSPTLIKPPSEMNRLSGLMFYSSVGAPATDSVNDIVVMKVIEAKQAATYNVSQFVFIQMISIANEGCERATMTILHDNLLHESYFSKHPPTALFRS